MKTTLKYIFVEAISKGIPQIILLFLALYMSQDFYATFILIFAIESLLVLLYPSHYVEVLYKLHNKQNESETFSTIFTVNIFILIILLFFTYLLSVHMFEFYQYSNIIVYYSIIISSFLTSLFRFKIVQNQINNMHNIALKILLISFSLSNIVILFLLFFIEDSIFAYFIGKTIGLSLFFLYFLYKFQLQFRINIRIILSYVTRIKYLFIYAFFSWIFGYGFTYISNLIGTKSDVAEVGYLLNISMLFLLLANGINSVYSPKIRKVILDNIEAAYSLSSKFIFIYFMLFIISFILVLFINYLHVDQLEKFYYSTIVSVFVFLFSSPKYVYEVYIYVNDYFKQYTFGLMIVELTALVILILMNEILSIKILYLYLILVFSRSLYVYYIFKYKIKGKKVV